MPPRPAHPPQENPAAPANALDLLLVSDGPPERLEACMESLLPALAAYHGPVRLLLLLDGRPPGGLAGLEAAGEEHHAFRVQIVRVPAWIGRPAAFNWLLTISNAPWTALVTDDVRVPRDGLNRLFDTLQRHPEVLAAGGSMTPIPAGVHQVIHPGDGLVLYRRTAFEAVPQFDIRYTPGSLERLDHAVALGMAGHALLMDGHVACAKLGGPALSPERVEAELQSGRIKFFGKWGDDILTVMEGRLTAGVAPGARLAPPVGTSPADPLREAA